MANVDKARKAKRAKALLEEKKDYIKKHGLNVNPRQSWTDIKKDIRRGKSKILVEKKIKYLESKGYDETQINKYKRAGWKKIYDYVGNVVYTAPNYFVLNFYDKNGDIDLQAAEEEFSEYTTEELIRLANEMYHNRLPDDDSSGYQGSYKVSIRRTRAEADEASKEYEERGYNPIELLAGYTAPGVSYTKVVVSNEYTVRGFAMMMCVIESRSKSIDIRGFYEDCEFYTKKFLPEIHKEIFED